ncbi:hypothetical protein BU23DRAFT_197634 [Bimuria novae-zelandiae CBS 107.79]|uniref:Inositol-pentakisphosphate 2-kinase n=1 Tax=Bimuria novae-zelandiae CBS 107.79 TaxID=1447943 RepID=A0A6A5V3Y4_9PLEO|nr:hypothetical protein BU23DRAFT_197634 [Bimuria novae-zelandiae CBS 107.79]
MAPSARHEPNILCRLASGDELSNAFRFKFCAEGAANAVFRLQPSSKGTCVVFEDHNGNVMERKGLQTKVLRISKGEPKTLRYNEIMAGFEEELLPLFRKTEQEEDDTSPRKALNLSIKESFEDFVMHHEGVSIYPGALHALMVEMHKHCPHNKHIGFHLLEERGILLPDMSPEDGITFTIEIKPKWLTQSLDAPRDAYLCRTCALQAARLDAARKPERPVKRDYICPLVLAAGKAPAIEQWLREKTRSLDPSTAAKIIARALPFFTTGPGHEILQHLRYLQSVVGTNVIRVTPPHDDEGYRLRLSMTLRDCSLFVRIPFDESSPIEAKLGDLDFKSLNKLVDWYKKEQVLGNGGWYLSRDSGMEGCWIAQGWRKYVPYYF